MTEQIHKKLDKISKSFWGFFIQRRPVAWLALIGIIIYGSISVMSMPREIQPEVKIPFVVVSVGLPGASPADTESLITIPLEKQISGLSDIKLLSSTSGFGFSSIFIEFDAKVDMEKVLQDTKDAVDLAKNELPDDATDPMVMKAEANAFSIITFSILGERPINELTKIAEDIQNTLEKDSAISQAPISGGQTKFIKITLDQHKVEGYGLSIQSISDIIKYANNNLPIGIVSSDNMNYSIRIDNRYAALEDIRNLPIITLSDENKTTILLRDIATVEEAYPAQSVISKVSVNGETSLPAVSIQVFKNDNTNIVAIAENSKATIEQLKEDKIIPQDVEVVVSNDNSVFISEELGNLTVNGIQTTILIIIILFLALGLSKGVIAGLSIPVIFMIAFIVMNSQGMTLNTLSLFSLVIALGLMVDTTIVIMEGIHENLKKGFTPKQAAFLSVDTYKWPLIAGTMTTVFAFSPMLLVSGILGEFLKTLPITISAALLGSLFVSLTIAPSIATKFIKAKAQDKKHSILEPIFEKIDVKFRKIIEYIVQKRIIRVFIILSALIALGLSLSLPITGALKTEMFTTTDQNYFVVDIEAPKGIIIEETRDITKEIEEYLYTIPEIDNFLTKIGTGESVGITDDEGLVSSGGSSESNIANITVNLVEKEERERKSYDIAKQIREHFKNFQGAKISIVEVSEGPPSDAAITVRITGTDFDKLNELAEEVKQIIQNIPGTTNTEISLNPGLNEFKYVLNNDVLSYHGLSSLQVSATIRNIIQGMNPTSITIEGEELEIIVKYNLTEINNKTNISIQDIENFEIQTPKGYSVTLGQLGDYYFGPSVSTISREDEKRIIKVVSDVEKDANSVEITEKIQEKINSMEIPTNYEIGFGGDFQEIEESFKDLFRSMFVAVILIAFTLVLMFNSFKQPLIILITLPLALIGVFPGLLLVGLNLSFPAFLGVVALTGIVVNDAIVLIDRINHNRKSGMPFAQSIAEASNARLQPILMTSITTIIGILPLSITNEFWAGLGFSLIFGLACSTVLTLVVIPVLYFALEGRKAKKQFKTL